MAWYDEPLTHGYFPGISGADTPHYARDYQTKFHEQITSLVAGTVTPETKFEPWGGQVFIKPDIPSKEEFYVYHLDTIDVHPGQHVNVGQEIGLAGGETAAQIKANPGAYRGYQTPVDPRYSSGLHTHAGWKERYVTTDWEDIGGKIEHGVSLPYGPDIGSIIDYYRERPSKPPPSSLISSPPSSGGVDPVSGKPFPGTDYSKMNTDSDGCTKPVSWTDTSALSDYLDCKMSHAGEYIVRGLFMIFGIVLVVQGVRTMTQPETENTFIGGQQPNQQQRQAKEPGPVKSLAGAAARGAATAIGGVAGEKIGKKIFKP